MSETTTGGLSTLFSAGSNAADMLPHNQDGLFQILHFAIHTTENAVRRSRWFGGRLFNKFSGESADYVRLSGAHLIQTLRVAGIQPPDFIVIAGKYLLRLDVAKEAHARLSESRKHSPTTFP
ncbi:hypothetical protein [Aliiroseovarius sp. YM-037]|uniref:hypothetical protein n=1 Tax=Aliiroseovarius sp. YM-037 TaxID=3341728 RepID=UPI003A7FA12E